MGMPSMGPTGSMQMAMMMMMTVMSAFMSQMMNPFGGGMMGGFPGFGGSQLGGGMPFGGGGVPGASSFLGGAPSGWGAALAKDAAANANGPGGYCYKWVGQALRRHGVNVSGASAYMGADQLAKNPKFREVKVNPQDLGKLPAGAVVVWNKGPGHPHGHISIALGNGKEASDKIRNQITNYGTSVRVFLPK